MPVADQAIVVLVCWELIDRVMVVCRRPAIDGGVAYGGTQLQPLRGVGRHPEGKWYGKHCLKEKCADYRCGD